MTEHDLVQQHRTKGTTLIEMVVCMGVLLLIISGSASLLVNSSRSAERAQVTTITDTELSLAAERINRDLLQARKIEITANGLGINIKYPASDADGKYNHSAKDMDPGPPHKFDEDHGNLIVDGDRDHPILTGIPQNDPDTGSRMQIFSYKPNNDKEIIVRLVSEHTIAGSRVVRSAITFRVQPRNL